MLDYVFFSTHIYVIVLAYWNNFFIQYLLKTQYKYLCQEGVLISQISADLLYASIYH